MRPGGDQRTLPLPYEVRRLRCDPTNREPMEIVLADGRREPVTEATLRAAPEAALRATALALGLLAGGLAAARLL